MDCSKSTKDIALEYAQRGWHVFPLHRIAKGVCTCGKADCHSPGKHPKTRNGLKDATNDSEAVARMNWRRANIGVRTGPESGIWVLDLDGADGIAQWAENVAEHAGDFDGDMPETLTASTGGGGRHLFFIYPAGREIANRTKIKTANGPLSIDVRGAGGYIVAAPSNHKSGGAYTWECEHAIAAAPAWLVEWVTPPSAPSTVSTPSTAISTTPSTTMASGDRAPIIDRAAKYLAKMAPSISGAGGHNAAIRAATAMVTRFALSDVEAWPLLAEWNQTCQPPWSDKELRHKLDQARQHPHGEYGDLLRDDGRDDWRAGRDDHRRAESRPEHRGAPVVQLAKIEPREPYPLEALPRVLREFVDGGARAIGCDPSYIALPLLAALAATIGTTRVLRLKAGWDAPSILWCAIVGESGTSKTPAFRLALKALRERQHDEHERHVAALADYETQLAQHERAMSDWKKAKGASDPPAKPQQPVAVRYIVSDTTVEAMAAILAENQRGVLLERDELSGWLDFDRYSGGKGGGDSAHWLSMHGGQPLSVDRKTGAARTIYVPRAAVSVCGGIQPGILDRALGAEHRESGLAARFLLTYPPRVAKRWTEDGIDPLLEAKLASLFGKLAELQPQENDDGRPQPVALMLTPEAKAVWIDYFNQHAGEQVELCGDTAAAWSKLEEYPARLALIIQLARYAAGEADGGAVDERSMASGIALATWHKGETRRVYALLGESDDERELRRLVEWLERHGGAATAREAQQGCRWLKAPGLAEAALTALANAGYGQWEASPAGQRGQPTRVFRLADECLRLRYCAKHGENPITVDVDNVDAPQNEPPADTRIAGQSEINSALNALADEADRIAETWGPGAEWGVV